MLFPQENLYFVSKTGLSPLAPLIGLIVYNRKVTIVYPLPCNNATQIICFLSVTSKFLVRMLSIDHGAALRERPGLHDSGQESGRRALSRLRLDSVLARAHFLTR